MSLMGSEKAEANWVSVVCSFHSECEVIGGGLLTSPGWSRKIRSLDWMESSRVGFLGSDIVLLRITSGVRSEIWQWR